MDVILDVDPGVDDALAILLALSSPEICVQGLTVVCGNVPLVRGTENALRVLAFAGREDVPVFIGADRPLRRQPVHATEVHGASGLGDAVLCAATQEAREDAVGFMVEMLDQRPGEVVLLAVGPLTNLALAEHQSPGILSKAKQIVVMGGAVSEPGNASPTAEFNFYADPDAAREVILAGADLVLVPLDVTHRIGIKREEIERVSGQSPRAEFFVQATSAVIRYGQKTGGYEGVFLHDPAAVALAIHPDLFSTEKVYCDVETDGELTAGQLVVDRRSGVLVAKRKGKPIEVALETDAAGVLELFNDRVLAKSI